MNASYFVVCFVKEAMRGKEGSKVWWGVASSGDTPSLSSWRTVCSSRRAHPASVTQNLRQAFHSWQHWIVVCRLGIYQNLCGLMPTSVAIILDAGGTS